MTKPRLTLIAALAHHRVIGIENRLPWHLPEDLQHFKQLTWGKPMIMGRKTFESIGRALPGRQTIVVTRQPTWHAPGVDVAHNLEQALTFSAPDQEERCLIGGEQLYQLALPLADVLKLTQINLEVKGDAYFPNFIATGVWCEITRTSHRSQTGIEYDFVEYHRTRKNTEQG